MDNLPGFIKRSGGPRTKRGKSASALNALRSGVYSSQTFLLGEDPKDYEELRRALFDDLKPETLMQHALADDVMTQLWRKFRLDRYSASSIHQLAVKRVTILDLTGDLGLEATAIVTSAKRLTEEVRRLGVTHYRAIAKRIREVRFRHPKHCEDLARFRLEHPDLDLLMRKLTWQPKRLDEFLGKNDVDSSGLTFWEKELASLQAWADGWVASFEHEEQLLEAMERIQNSRVYRHLIAVDNGRALCDIGRALHRALQEYYKQRERDHSEKQTDSHLLGPSDTKGNERVCE